MAGLLLHYENLLAADNRLGYFSAVSATSTANGYNPENIRDPNLFTGWRPAASAITEYLQFNLTTPLSGNYYYGLAYDMRHLVSGDRAQILIKASTSSGSGYSTLFTLNYTIGANFYREMNVFIGSAGMAGEQYLRYECTYSGSGTDEGPILLYAGVTDSSGLLDYQTPIDGNAPTPGAVGMKTNVPIRRTVSGAYLINRVAMPQEKFEYLLKPADSNHYDKIARMFTRYGAAQRCMFAQIDNVVSFFNAPTCVVRLDGDAWDGQKLGSGNTDVSIPFITEPYSL